MIFQGLFKFRGWEHWLCVKPAKDTEEPRWWFIYLFAFYFVPQPEERRASSVLNYDFKKALSCGLVKSHLEYHSQVGASQPQKEGSR